MADAAAEFLGLGATSTGHTAGDEPKTEPPSRQRAARAVPRVVVVTTPEQLAGTEGAGAAVTTDGALVDRGALTRIACDAVIDRVVLDKAARCWRWTPSAGSPPPPSRPPSPPATAAASGPAAPPRRRCARPTTSSGGPAADPPPSTTWRCSATATTR